MRRSLWCVPAILASAVVAGAQNSLPAAQVAAIDSMFEVYARPGGPGCAAAVYQNGAMTFARGYGLANITNGVPITTTTRFTTGSVSKQFTAASIALLVRAGKISLDDDVRKYVPELVDYGTPIRIRHLVHHTSGLRDFWELVDLAGMRPDDGYTVDDMLALAAKQKGLNFPPGAEYRYSNTGYLVLGVVVKRVTGQSLRAFADSAIFRPLGMTETLFLDDHNEIVSRRAMAYSPFNGTWKVNVWNNDLVGQGGIVTSLADLQKWDENFYTGKLGGKEFIDLVQSTDRLNGGGENNYAFGLTVQEYRGQRLVQHTGATGGYRAALYRFPDQHTSFAMMCNISSANTGALALGMADVVMSMRLGSRSSSEARTARPDIWLVDHVGDAATLPGRYESSELNDAVWEIIAGPIPTNIEMHRLRHPPVKLNASFTRDYVSADGSIRLKFDAPISGKSPGFRVFGSRVSDLRFTRILP